MSTQRVLLQMDLARALRGFLAELAEARTGLANDIDHGAWCWPVGGDARQRVIEAITTVRYQDGQAPNTALSFPGVVAVSPETAAALEALNAAKNTLRAALRAMDGQRVTRADGVREPLSRAALHDLGEPRLHLLQAWRLVPLIARPLQIGFTWAHVRKVSRLSVAEATTRLQRLGEGPHLQMQLARLAELDPAETLAEVLPAAVHPRANLLMDAKGARQQLRVVLPIAFIDAPHRPLPPISALPPTREADPYRLRRRDVRLEDEPFLPSLHVHRYLPEARHLSPSPGASA